MVLGWPDSNCPVLERKDHGSIVHVTTWCAGLWRGLRAGNA